jgi:hypothetical protein
MALSIGQAEATDERTPVQRAVEDVRRDPVEPQLGSPEQRELLWVVDGAPRQIDEPAARRALDVRALRSTSVADRMAIAFDGPCG